MTKAKIIETIQAKESELWLALAEYDYGNAPRTGSTQDDINWDLSDVGHNKILRAWSTVYSLMEELEIPCSSDDINHKTASYLASYLWEERQAARTA